MTITEHLQFSVLSAPVATIDRRGLSQAWYSALYGTQNHTGAPPRPRDLTTAERFAPPRSFATAQPKVHPPMHQAKNGSLRALDEPVLGIERRAARSLLARRIERTFFRSNLPPQQATFRLGREGRVAILLRSRNGGLELVAICAQRAQPRVAAALAQARYALAERGIALKAMPVVERAQ